MHPSYPSTWQAEVVLTGNQNDHSDGHNSVSLRKVTELSLDRLVCIMQSVWRREPKKL